MTDQLKKPMLQLEQAQKLVAQIVQMEVELQKVAEDLEFYRSLPDFEELAGEDSERLNSKLSTLRRKLGRVEDYLEERFGRRCEACHGRGEVQHQRLSDVLVPCPRCQGKKVISRPFAEEAVPASSS